MLGDIQPRCFSKSDNVIDWFRSSLSVNRITGSGMVSCHDSSGLLALALPYVKIH